MKMVIKINQKDVSHRDNAAREMLTNPIYRSKVVVSKKVYNRKKLKPIKHSIEE